MPNHRFPKAGDAQLSGPVEANASAPTSKSQGAARQMPASPNRKNARPAQNTANARMLTMVQSAQNAQPANMIIRPGGPNGDDRVIFSKTLSALASMQDFLPLGAELAGMVNDDGHITLDPPYQNAGKSITVEAAMSQSSRVLSAGATLIQGVETWQDIPTKHGPISGRSAISFSTFEPMKFDLVDFVAEPNAELPLSPAPFKTAEIDIKAFDQFGVALRLSRRQIKDVTPERLAVQLLWPLIQGLGRAVDAAFFKALGSIGLTPWALGAAAAQGIPFSSLRAVVGTSGAGAATDQGQLYAGGVPAELTPDTAGSYIGVFSRAAMVTNEEVQIIATRTDASGALEITCWLGLQALIPDPSKFWSVP